MDAISRSAAAQQCEWDKESISNFTHSLTRSYLLIYGRRRNWITDAPVSSWCASWAAANLPTSKSTSPAVPGDQQYAFSCSSSYDFWRQSRPALLDDRPRPVACSNWSPDEQTIHVVLAFNTATSSFATASIVALLQTC